DCEKAYDAWAQVYAKAAFVFQQPDACWFAETLKMVGIFLLDLAIEVDAYTLSSTFPKVTDAASRLSKSAGVAGNDRASQPCAHTKRRAALWLANTSFKAYFKLNNIRLCSTVLGSVENAFKLNAQFADSAEKATVVKSGSAEGLPGEEAYDVAERVTYHFFVGRLRLSQHRIRLAYKELRWAFDHCNVRHLKNLRRITISLTATALVLGIFPSPIILIELGLWAIFGPLMQAMRKGNGAGLLQALEQNREWFRKHGLFLLLSEKLQVGTWRCLVRQALLIYRTRSTDSAAAASPTLPLSDLLILARAAWQDPELTLVDVESIVASLIAQGYVKAYILHSKALIVFQKGERMGLVPMNSVYPRDE
ncbi:hypothetical protein K437DRAFT_225747, partial [Tilletiaria anomala UBC 951]